MNYLLTYKRGSESSKNLYNALKNNVPRGFRDIKRLDGRYLGDFEFRQGDKIVNWGFGGNVRFPNGILCLNYPEIVNKASNKLSFFSTVKAHGKERYIPEFTDFRDVAVNWQQQDAIVVARMTVRGHSAEGLEIIRPGQDIPDAPLYTKYIKKEDEYRFHLQSLSVRKEMVFDVQKKSVKIGTPKDQINYLVRNHNNGFIFTRDNIDKEGNSYRTSMAAAMEIHNIIGLSFGAYDVIYNSYYNRAYVLEVNTAPGLEGQTLTNYSNLMLDVL